MTLPKVSDLFEFKYMFGDPRLTLQTFLEKNENVDFAPMAVYRCDLETNSRDTFFAKNFVFEEEIVKTKKDGVAPILIIPFKLVGKFACKLKSKGDHMNYLLFNRYTHEFERLDIKKYHIEDFKIKKVYKHMSRKIRELAIPLIPEAQMLQDIYPTNEFVKRFEGMSMANLFPIYFISYILMRCTFPKKTSEKIMEEMSIMPDSNLTKNWEKYAKISRDTLKTCKDQEKYIHLEKNRCLKNLKQYLLEKPIKECPYGKVFNFFTNRCADPSRIKDINIKLAEILNVTVNNKTEFKHLGTKETVLPSVLYVLSKYPGAVLIHTDTLKNMETDSHAAIWKPSTAQDFRINKGFATVWKKQMGNPDARFIIMLVTMTSATAGSHANVMIYDKKSNEVERFDSLGNSTHLSYQTDKFDIKMQKWLENKVPQGYKYFTPIDFCPKSDIFQVKELYQVGFNDLSGSCAVWRLWYIDIRMANPGLKRDQVVKMAMTKLNSVGNFQQFIKSYQLFIQQGAF